MLLAPPILFSQRKTEANDDWVRRCIHVDKNRDFPVNNLGAWHGGVHIPHTDAGGTANPVRAIAEGEIVFCRYPSDRISEDPLCYLGATDDGVVLLRHTLTLGDPEVNIVFYSLCQHLKQVRRNVLEGVGTPIKKGTILGTSGRVDGKNGFHFQICCDDKNLQKLAGRSTGNLDISKPGRSDITYGDKHYYLPSGTPFMAAPDEKKATRPPLYISDTELFVTFTDKKVFTRQENPAGSSIYTKLSEAGVRLPAAPARDYGETVTWNEAEWICANYPGGSGWVKMTAPGINQYSDADFPHWTGWSLVDDDSNADSQCDSPVIQQWQQQIKDEKSLKEKYFYAICRFPFEWDETTLDSRFSWLKQDNKFVQPAFNPPSWDKFINHTNALSFFDKLPADARTALSDRIWHFNPAAFITHINKASQVEYIAVVGTQIHADPANKLSFIGQAVRYMRRYKAIESNSKYTILVFDIGYKSEHFKLLELSCRKFGFEYKKVDGSFEFFAHLNNGSDRSIIPVKQLSVFCHGLPSEFAFGYGYPDAERLSVNLHNFTEIQSDIFNQSGRINSYACRTAMGRIDGHSEFELTPQEEDSLAQKMAEYFNIPVSAYVVRSDYADTWGSKLQRFAHKLNKMDWFEELSLERAENIKYCGAAYNIDGALNDVGVGTTPYNLSKEYKDYLPK